MTPDRKIPTSYPPLFHHAWLNDVMKPSHTIVPIYVPTTASALHVYFKEKLFELK